MADFQSTLDGTILVKDDVFVSYGDTKALDIFLYRNILFIYELEMTTLRRRSDF
jgi:hypothetical protein